MLESHTQIVQQARQFLSDISPQEYTTVCKPHLSGSAGAHMRHVTDHYLALINGIDDGLIDYNVRHRFSQVEMCPSSALEVWQEIETHLTSLCSQPQDAPLEVISETSISQTHTQRVPSTLARELVFVLSHAIHHFSLLAVLRSLQGKTTPDHFGMAPATVTFARQQA